MTKRETWRHRPSNRRCKQDVKTANNLRKSSRDLREVKTIEKVDRKGTLETTENHGWQRSRRNYSKDIRML